MDKLDAQVWVHKKGPTHDITSMCGFTSTRTQVGHDLPSG